MGNIWISTDLHLWSRDNDSRHPFRSRHNLGKLSDQFAQDIQDDDLLIFLGDLCDPDVTDTAKLAAIVQRIPCRKLMCRGNHDIQDDAFYLEVGFDEVTEVIRLYNIIFSHKPIKVAADEVNIHGHLHTEKLVTMGYNHINAYAANWNTDDRPVLLDDLLKSAIVQEHEYTPKELAHVTEKFEKYTSLENDQYTKILDISDWFPLCPVDEAAADPLVKIIEFQDWIHNNFTYGLRINGVYDPGRNTTAEDWDKYLIVQSPEEFECSKVGVCWDYTSYEAWYFKRNFPKVRVTTWYIVWGVQPDCPTHTFITFTYQGNHYYFEDSFHDIAGVWASDSEKDTIDFVIASMVKHDPRLAAAAKRSNFGVFRYNALDEELFGLGCVDYMKWMLTNGKEVNHKFNTAYKAPVKMNAVVENKRDIIDEVLFKDVDDTKYWLKDDKEYREQAEKGEQSDKSVAAIDEVSSRSSFSANLVHLSTEYDSDREGGECVLTPAIPDNFMTKNGFEDNTTPRVCFSTSISKALRAMSANVKGMEFYVYVPIPKIFDKYKVITPDATQVPDVDITEERWICDPVRVACAGKIKVKGPTRGVGYTYAYGNNQKAKLYDWSWEWVERNETDVRGCKIIFNEAADTIEYQIPTGNTAHSRTILLEMAYEDAADLMLHRLGHYCKEFNNHPQFEQIEKVWKKNWPNEKPPKLSPYMEVSSDSQLSFNLAHEINTDNDDGLRKVVTYTNIMHDLRKALEKDKEIRDCAYIVGMYDLVEDGVLLYINLKGIDAFSADDPEVYWPDITPFESPRENENDYVSHDGIKVVFENDKHVKIGEVSISGISTDEPYLYDLEVYSRYRGKNYGNAIMRYVMRKYKPTELCVEWKNEIAQKLYERFGFKKDAIIEDYHTTLIVMRTKRKHTGSFKSNEESISESSTINENFIGTVPDLEWHRDEWKANDKNFLFICGLSGGGKTTLASQISQEVKCEVIHLDDLAQAAFVGKMANPDFRKRMSPTMQDYWNSTTNHIKMYAWGDQRLALETENFIQWMIKNHAKDGKLYIIEGCEIMYMDADYLIEQPLIIKGTSAIRTTFWRFKRTYGQHREKGESMLKAFEHCMIQIMKIYKNGSMIAAENGLMRFKDVLKAARNYNEFARSAMNESVADTHQMDREQKADVAKKYGLQAVGDTHEAEEAEEKEQKLKEAEKAKLEKKKELERKREARNKALAKGRRTQKRNRIIKKVKSHLPGVKNEEADAVDGSDAAYIDDIYVEHDHSGDKIRFFDNPRNYADAALDESTHTYRFEMLEQIQFFDRIDESSSDEKTPCPVYVVLINGKSPVSAMIRGLTHAEFTHASISFDSSLTKMYSFAGKDLENRIQALIGGFKLENIKDKFYTENKIPYAVYVIPSTKGAVKRMKKRLDYFIQHETKFRFDYLGLVKNFFKIPDDPENTWFCSRFVADILNAGNPDKKLIDQPSLYRPEDFKSAGFAQFVDSGLAANYNKKIVDQKTKMILRAKKLDEGILDVSLDNPWAHQVLNYQLTTMSESVVDDFVTYLKSFKLRFDKDGNIVVTRREFDQLDMHFRSSLKTIKACETAGNVEGVKEELYKIHYMVELINQYYLRPDVKNMRSNAKDVRKDMLDLRSVMLNAFQQHLKYVTTRDPRWNFQVGYDSSKYGKNITIPQKVITAIGKTVVTVLT